jgi:DNA-binding LytR/AlgR family response regulator
MVVAQLRLLGKQKTITGKYNGEIYFLDYNDVIYFDTADRKTFIYTIDKVYETALKLYQLEDMLKDTSFMRASKKMILNIKKINSIGHTFSGKMIATLINGEKAEISRMYEPLLREKLGI